MPYTNHVRIIGGTFSSRNIHFPNALHLKPTGSRIRETLFNWLMHDIDGANCLDAFAGSGILGFEALSRGAKSVTFTDNNPKVVHALKENIAMLGVESRCQVRNTDIIKLLPEPMAQRFDLVLLDPPFKKDDLPTILEHLIHQQALKLGAKIYVEYAREKYNSQTLHQALQLLKHKIIGEVEFGLYAHGSAINFPSDF